MNTQTEQKIENKIVELKNRFIHLIEKEEFFETYLNDIHLISNLDIEEPISGINIHKQVYNNLKIESEFIIPTIMNEMLDTTIWLMGLSKELNLIKIYLNETETEILNNKWVGNEDDIDFKEEYKSEIDKLKREYKYWLLLNYRYDEYLENHNCV